MTEKEFEHTIMPLAENVYSYAVNMLGNPDDAADITQDVMLRLWETRRKLQDMDSPKAWALRMTRNLCLDHLKRRRPVCDEEALLSHGGYADDLQQQIERKDMAEIVRRLESVFHVRIVVNVPALLQERYYGDFRGKDDIFDILDVMLRGEAVSYQIKGDTICIDE